MNGDRFLSVLKSKIFKIMPVTLTLALYKAMMRVHSYRHNPTGGPVSVSLKETSVLVSDRDYTLALPSFRNVPRFRRGMARQLERLARKYGADTFFTPKSGDVVLDVGANIGEFSIYCAAKGAGIVAFEPDPVVYKCLTQNLARFQNVSALPVALWHERTTQRFYSAFDSSDSSLIKPDEVIHSFFDVDCQPLDEIPMLAEFQHIDFLKMDGEGAEPEILSGAKETLRRIRRAAIDVGPERHGKDTKEEVGVIFREHGFRILDESPEHVLFAENMGWKTK